HPVGSACHDVRADVLPVACRGRHDPERLVGDPEGLGDTAPEVLRVHGRAQRLVIRRVLHRRGVCQSLQSMLRSPDGEVRHVVDGVLAAACRSHRRDGARSRANTKQRVGNGIGTRRVAYPVATGRFGIRHTHDTSRTAQTRTATNTGATDAANCAASGAPVVVSSATAPPRAASASAPTPATPTALPIARAKAFAPVTTPRSDHSTLDCAAISDGLAINPIPRPTSTQQTATCQGAEF